MKKITVEISLRDARDVYWRIEDNHSFSENGEWSASNVWESKEFNEYDENEQDEMNQLLYALEDLLSGFEYEIEIIDID